MSLTTTTCDDEEEYIVFDQSRYTQILFFVNIFNLCLMPIYVFSTIDSVTLGRLLFKISRKKNKQKSRTRIRYRLSTRFDLRNLNYATENEPEENSNLEEIEETKEREENISFVREVGSQPQLREFEEISVESLNVGENTASQELDRKVMDS